MEAVGAICCPVQRVHLCAECFSRPAPFGEPTCGAPECVASFNRWLDVREPSNQAGSIHEAEAAEVHWCAYCEGVEVTNPNDFCSEECADSAAHDAAEDARADLEEE
jgi:hypothetical protein